MKDKYSFLEEGPWQQTVGNAIGGLARNGSFTNGAVVGAGVGSVGNVVKNAMKRDDDPTKKGTLSSAIKGAVGGAAAGAVLGRTLGAAARTKAGQTLQNNLFDKAATEYGQSAVSREIANGNLVLPQNASQNQIMQYRKAAERIMQSERDRALSTVKDIKPAFWTGGGHWSLRSGVWHGKNMGYDPVITQA